MTQGRCSRVSMSMVWSGRRGKCPRSGTRSMGESRPRLILARQPVCGQRCSLRPVVTAGVGAGGCGSAAIHSRHLACVGSAHTPRPASVYMTKATSRQPRHAARVSSPQGSLTCLQCVSLRLLREVLLCGRAQSALVVPRPRESRATSLRVLASFFRLFRAREWLTYRPRESGCKKRAYRNYAWFAVDRAGRALSRRAAQASMLLEPTSAYVGVRPILVGAGS
jgi:hypothetical protein